MSVVIGLLQALTRDDCWIDDSTDRLTRRYIVAVVAIQLLVVYGGGFLRGNPIQCFTPKYFTPPQESYSEQLCWLESTHYIIEPVDPSKTVDNIGSMGFYNVPIYKTTGGKSGYVGLYNKGQRITVSYYQWVPIYMIFIALFAHLPFVFWKYVTQRYGLPLKSIISAARAMSAVDQQGETLRAGYGDDLVEVLLRYCESSRYEKKTSISVSRSRGNVVFGCYIFVKFLYILMFSLQLLFLQLFLGSDPRFDILHHGAFVFYHIFNNGTWPQHPAFPVDTTCIVMTEQQGNPLPYTLQCILPMNLYFDKFFALYTIGFPILIGGFVLSLFFWIKAASKSGRKKFLESHLIKPLGLDAAERRYSTAIASSSSSATSSTAAAAAFLSATSDLRDVAEFNEQFLRRDGIFALEMIKMNVGRFVTETILERLWNRYCELKRERKIMKKRLEDIVGCSSSSTSEATSSAEGEITPGSETPPKKPLYDHAALKQRPSAPYNSVIH